MLLGMLTAVGGASTLIYVWVLQDFDSEREPARIEADDEELRQAA